MRFLYYPLVFICLALAVVECIPLVKWAIAHYQTYQWLLYGMGGYIVLKFIPFFFRNEKWLQTTSHEMTHAVVGMMFFHKIHSLQAGEGEGVVSHSGRRFGQIFISLAPYCLPIFTFAMLFLRLLGDNKSLYIFDIIIGVTLAFHIGCFAKQTGSHQTDISEQGFLRSYLFILTAWVFNASIILLSIRKGIIGAFTYLFPEYWNDLVKWWGVIVDTVQQIVSSI